MIAQISTLKMSKKKIVLFLLMLPHLKPESFDYISPSLDTIYNVGKLVSIAFLLLLFFTKKKKPSRIITILFLMQVWVLMSTILNSGDVKRAILTMISIIALAMIVDMYSDKILRLLSAIMGNLELLIYINLITLLMFPGGLYRQGVHSEFICYFLGFKNAFFSYCLIAILVAFINVAINKRYFRSVLLILASLLNVTIGWSATSVAALILVVALGIYVLLVRKTKLFQVLTYMKVFLLSLVFNILMVFFEFFSSSNIFNYLVVNVFNKQDTMTTRKVIWSLASQMIAQKPLIGYGIGEHVSWAGYTWHGHNRIVQFLLEGGVPNLLFYVILIICISRVMVRCKKTVMYNIFMATWCGFFVYSMAESGSTAIMFSVLFVLTYHIDNLASKEEQVLTITNSL